MTSSFCFLYVEDKHGSACFFKLLRGFGWFFGWQAGAFQKGELVSHLSFFESVLGQVFTWRRRGKINIWLSSSSEALCHLDTVCWWCIQLHSIPSKQNKSTNKQTDKKTKITRPQYLSQWLKYKAGTILRAARDPGSFMPGASPLERRVVISLKLTGAITRSPDSCGLRAFAHEKWKLMLTQKPVHEFNSHKLETTHIFSSSWMGKQINVQ